ncbi:MAG: ABC transporter permease [Geminicoccaceae bacterium]|nr:MAG: ABC transporter permease [Geminicoccaceae bacterium]
MSLAENLKAVASRLVDGLEVVRAALWPKPLAWATGYALLLPALLVVGLLALGLVYIVDASFRELDTRTFLLAETYSLGNFQEIWERTVFWRITGRTLLAAVIVTAITLALAFPYAYLMVRTRSSLLRKLLLISLFLPFFIGQVVRAYGWLIILGQQGIANTLLQQIGLGPFRLIFTYETVIFGLVQYMLPFAVLMLAPALAAISEEVELAAESLGARWWEAMLNVVVPMAKPGFVAAGVVVFTISLTDFAMPAVLGGGTNDFLANSIYHAFFRISDPGLASALAVILVAIGSTIVAILFAWLGTGTLGFRKSSGASA